jgi:hypothetical protein
VNKLKRTREVMRRNEVEEQEYEEKQRERRKR